MTDTAGAPAPEAMRYAPAMAGAAAPAPPYGPPIRFADAARLAAAAEEYATTRAWPMVIAIADSGARLVLLHRMDGAQLGSIEIAQAKARTAVEFRRPTAAFERLLADGGANLRLLGAPGILPLEGGVPILRDGAIIGAIGISGMAPSQDGEVAAAAVGALG